MSQCEWGAKINSLKTEKGFSKSRRGSTPNFPNSFSHSRVDTAERAGLFDLFKSLVANPKHK